MKKRAFSKRGFGLLVGCSLIVFCWVTFSAAVVESPETVVLQSDLWASKKYEAVTFPHAKHVTDYKISCKECHHVFRDGVNVWKEGDPVQKCEGCHNVAKTGKALREASAAEKKRSLYKAYHTNCKGCHKAQKKGPVKCTECHAKKKK